MSASLAFTAGAFALQENPVYVDDSPQARELFQLGEEQIVVNLTEAARTFQELLDEYAHRLVPLTATSRGAGAGGGWGLSANGFTTVRHRVIDVLRDPNHGLLLDRYRAIETPRAQRMLDAGTQGELEWLVLTRSLTEPALEAMLRMGQLHLEAGRFRAAGGLLAEATLHPDLPRDAKRAAHAWFMLGLASHYEGDRAAVKEAINELALLGVSHDALIDQLLQVAEAPGSPHKPFVGVSTFDEGRAGDLSGLVAEEIWSVELTEGPLARQASAAAGRRGPMPGGFRGATHQANVDDGRLASMVPTVAELTGAATTANGGALHPGSSAGASVVYVNQGHTITALDRFTGNRIWERDYVDRATLLLVDRTGEQIMDPNVVAVRGDSLVTITGHAHGSSRSSDGRVVCLSAATGDLRWAVRLDRIEIGRPARPAASPDHAFFGEEAEGLFPHGRPIILDDLVIIKARRISPQALTSAYLVALSLDDGGVRWVRHIASSGSIRRVSRAFSAMVLYPPLADAHDAPQEADTPKKNPPTQIYIVTAVGAVASVNPRTGEINWLHRFSVPLNPLPQDLNVRPWEVATPHVTHDRVFAIHAGRRLVAVYDRETGTLIETVDAGSRETWNSPLYLLGDGRMLYAVTGGGRDVRAFRLDDLRRPAWIFPRGTFNIRGRVQLADVGLIVPTAQGVVVLDRDSGDVLAQLPIEPTSSTVVAEWGGPAEVAGNAVAFDSQIILVTDRRISAFMSLHRAEQMLRERIVVAPHNPEPALSLVRLALRARNLDLALEAGELALAAIDAERGGRAVPHRAVTPRDRLVTLLLELDSNEVPQTRDEIESLFDLVSRAAWSPEQRLAHLLAYGDRLAQFDPQRAVEAWQSVLSEPALARVSRLERDVERRGRDWAASRLASAIEQYGPAIYEAHSRRAQQTLADLERRRGGADELIALAEEYPHADAAVDALLAASSLLASAGDRQRSLAVLRAHNPVASAHSHRLIEAYAALARELNFNSRAEAAIQPAAPPRLAIAGTPSGPARVLPGRVITPPSDAGASAPTDRLLLAGDRQLTMLAAANGAEGRALSTLWATSFDANPAALSIVRWSERVLLVGVSDELDPRIVSIDPATGDLLWRTPRFLDIFGVQRRIEVAIAPTGEAVDLGAVIAFADDETLVLVQRSGNVAAFDLTESGRPLWQSGPQLSNAPRDAHSIPLVRSAAIEAVQFAQSRGGMLALMGAARRESGRAAPAIAVLDMRTGESVVPTIVWLDADPLWVALSATGRVLYGGAAGVGCIDVWRGDHAWVNIAPEAADAKRAWLARGAANERLYFEDAQSNVRSASARTGVMTSTFQVPRDPGLPPPPLAQQTRLPVGANDLIAVRPVAGGEVIGHYRQRIVRYSSDGEIIGADVLSGDRNFTWLLTGTARQRIEGRNEAVDDRYILVNALPPMQSVVPGSPVGARRTQHRHHIYVLSENVRLIADPIELPPLPEPIRHAMLIDGWLVLSLSERAIAIPLE